MSAVLTIPEACALLGLSKNSGYQAARRDGELVGIPVLRVGHRLLVPKAPFFAALGLDPHTVDEAEG